ncbi:hypothetical protein [Halorubellus litoreus]|uniref:Uncharacterized protein n=1 Tax=Halorubellus litoreus TaxID=755308 RepID=A0ABD5VEY0_9EURY
MVVSSQAFSISIILGITADIVLIFLINPATLTEPPTSNEIASAVDQFAGRALSILAVVLVVLQFTLDGSDITHFEELTLIALTVSAGLLMVTFILELVGAIRILFFRLQLSALRYAGLLLFLSIVLVLKAKSVPEIMPFSLSVFVGLSWIIWILHELHYIFKTQREEWDSIDMKRCDWAIRTIESWRG